MFKKIIINLGVALASIFLFFVIAEIICFFCYDESSNYQKWIWNKLQQSGSRSFTFSDEKVYINKDDGLQYKIDGRLDVQKYADFNYESVVNSEKKEGEYRILVLGDSLTGGSGLENVSNKYVALLSKNENFKNYTFYSLSQGGFNTYQEWLLLNEVMEKLKLDLVILQYADRNIAPIQLPLGTNNQNFWINAKTDFLMLDNAIAPTLPILSKRINWYLLNYSSFLRFVSYKLNIILANNVDDNDINLSFESVKKMAVLARGNGVKFIMIDLPPTAEPEDHCGYIDDHSGKALHNQLKKICEELKVPYYNMCDYVSDLHSIQSKLEERPYHYNEQGHKIVAEILADAISKINK